MFKKYKINIIIFLLLTITGNVYANNEVSNGTKIFFEKYSKKINLKYSASEEIVYYKNLNNKLYLIESKGILKPNQITIINELISLINEEIFSLELYKLEEKNKIKINSNNISKKFNKKSYNSENIFKENGVWYSYNYDGYLSFPKGVNISSRDLNYNGINTTNSIVFLRETGGFGFITKYKKVKLISDKIIYGYPDKFNLLSEIKRDKRYIVKETDNDFVKLQNLTLDLTKGLNKEEKIEKIYDYILKNITYSNNFTLQDYEIFSGIETFLNNDGVCDGYVKLFIYMLTFAGISDTEAIRGYVIDAQDFPKVGHAWVKIGEKYYDPTFDDPIGLSKTKNINNYKFYKLPYDLFYTNRFKYEETPEYLKTETLEYRKNYINNNLAKLVPKYKNSNYRLLKPFSFKAKHNIDFDKKISIDDLKKVISFSEVNDFQFNLNGKSKNITSLKYFNITNNTAEDLATQLSFNFENYFLFKWRLDNGTYEYRLAYEVKYY